MKTRILNTLIPALFGVFAIVAIGSGCSPQVSEGDETGPTITIISPSQNATFYTEGGIDSPDFMNLKAEGDDDSTITKASITVFNRDDDIVLEWDYLHDQTIATKKNISTNFRTPTDGEFTVEFMFKDAAGNSSTETRNITCIYSELSGETDTN